MEENKVRSPPPPLELRKKAEKSAEANRKSEDVTKVEKLSEVDQGAGGIELETNSEETAAQGKHSKISFFTLFCSFGLAISIALAVLFVFLLCR